MPQINTNSIFETQPAPHSVYATISSKVIRLFGQAAAPALLEPPRGQNIPGDFTVLYHPAADYYGSMESFLLPSVCSAFP